MSLNLPPAERLIVAADFEPDEETGTAGVKKKVVELARSLSGLGCYIKVESVLRACGYELIDALHYYGVKVFADLKLSGIPQTLRHDGLLLRPHKPELVTAMCPTGVDSMRALKDALPVAEVLGVTFLTTMSEPDAKRLFGEESENDAVLKFGREAEAAAFDGLISAPGELGVLRAAFGDRLTYNTPNVRPDATEVARDDQNRKRSMTPRRAIESGATRLVIGRPITQAASPRDAAVNIIRDIATTF